jgi:hypothetical protein
MARRYSRDNRGRFAGGGGGATARGGRLKTASGNKRKTQNISVLSGDRMSAVPKGTVGRTRKERQIQAIDRPLKSRPAFNAAKSQQKANIAARAATKPVATKGARLGGTRRSTRAAAPANTAANRTGQSKTLNKFNSKPVGTMVAGKGINLVPSTKRVPLNIAQKASDQAFARTATKAARTRALIPAKTQQKQTTAQRATRAATNQSRVTQAVLAKSSRRPTRKQRRSILTAESAKRFYATKAVDYLKVNVNKPGFRLPRGMR